MASALLASRAEPLWGERKVYARKQPNTQTPNPNPNFDYQQQIDEIESVSISSDSSAAAAQNHHSKESVHDGLVTFNIAAYTKGELKDLKKRLAYELQQVQKLRNQIELREMGHQEMKLVKGVGKNNKKRGSSSVIDLSRDLKKQALEWEGQFGKVLEKIMKHKHAWVFNSPVDVVGMGLHDYNAIIKQPMDLGTAKLNLERGLYSTPVEFAQDVRLTFNNALTYNPPGHDVFIMAKDLLARFERSFSPAFKKFQQQTQRNNHNVAQQQQQQQQQMKWGGGDQHSDRFEERRAAAAYHRTPTVEAAVARKPMPVPMPREEVVVPEMEVTRPPVVLERSGGNGKLAKPKAKDLNKRMMTFEEKQKMSLCLEELPQEKMDQVVQIMRRRNAALSQKDDEIEVDIEVLDIETLWELDRFVCNYNKMVSKIKKIEALDGGQKPLVSADGNKSPVSEMTEAVASEKSKKIEPVCVEEDIDIGEDMPTHNFPPVEIEKESSSSGGSSGSDSDSSSGSDTSSDSDSDADDAQSPCVESKSSPKS